jgi:pseudouridine-5'-phosphate glycosidase
MTRPRVALETTLLLHGVPREEATALARDLGSVVRARGAEPALVGVLRGSPVVGLSDRQLADLVAMPPAQTPKLNTANLGLTLARGGSGATTVSTTMELAAGAGVWVFATGGLGGVHPGAAAGHIDVSSDLMAFTRFPVGVVTAGVKSILDVAATRELLETLGVPVVGYRTDRFPAFYLRETSPAIGVDARFDEVAPLAAFVRKELARTRRGVVICNPIAPEHELPAPDWDRWLREAQADAQAAGVAARDVTPFLLARVHERSGGATLRANIELVKSNAALAAELAVAMHSDASSGLKVKP